MINWKNLLNAILFATILQSCIDPYYAEDTKGEGSVVVDGLITDEDEKQVIRLSYSAPLKAQEFLPVKNADVIVIDKANNVFEFTEDFNARGMYRGNIPQEFLVAGNAFKISISLQNNGGDYESEFEEMLPSPPIDSVYYEINNDYYALNSNYKEKGVEFFVDVKANKDYSSYYKWEVVETYEYHATWPIEKIWASEVRYYESPVYDYYTCYRTGVVPNLAIASTANLDENLYLKFPLLFVNNASQRLYHRYSLFIKQFSLNQEAYYYWDRLKSNNQQSGGLFDTQPQQQQGNVKCITRPDEKVLGLFSVACVSVKRINISAENNLRGKLIYDQNVWCEALEMSDQHWVYESKRSDWPIYLAPSPEGSEGSDFYADPSCFDCRLQGGVLEEPEFWNK